MTDDVQPGPGYSEDTATHQPPAFALPIEGMAVYEIGGAMRVVLEVHVGPLRAGVILDAEDTEAIARLAGYVASNTRHDA